jgi:hypothetical protein
MAQAASAVLVIECIGVLGLGGSPITASLDDKPIFLRWDKAETFTLPAGAHGIRIHHEPIRWPLGANRIARSLQLNGGFRYTLRYTPRAAPFLAAKLSLDVDRPAG